ncbi:dysbindin domain-containing protein 2-like [Rhinatrema bivittatum]|uniref:dysbindin domain-containing protein 2-like n=1 Tax=Rhinatrema bivittatum TaxID=194408 RepID=UPI00112E69D8|nr:dysbindin domain-containing protein 2-like [Rhinatrema bivittatum]
MSAPGAPSQSRRLPSEATPPRVRDMEPSQQHLKLRERQKFFEEVFQHDVDYYFPISHLQFEHKRPPLGSISSMEVNVDMLEQIDAFDFNDQDTMDVFLSSEPEEASIQSHLPGPGKDEITSSNEAKSHISSSSSCLSMDMNSLDRCEESPGTPGAQTDEEEGHVNHSISTNTDQENRH